MTKGQVIVNPRVPADPSLAARLRDHIPPTADEFVVDFGELVHYPCGNIVLHWDNLDPIGFVSLLQAVQDHVCTPKWG